MVSLTQVVFVVFSSCDTKHIFSFLINFIVHSFIDNHMPVLSSFGLSMIDEDCHLLLLQWIPILHKYSYKQCCIARAAKFSIKPLSKILTSIFTAVKTGLQKYCFYLHAYEADFLQWLLRNKDRILAHIFNSSFRYVDDVLSLNNSLFGD